MARDEKIYGRKWWTHEWLVLLSVLDPARMERAEEYAAGGKVTNLQIRAQSVTAMVRGSRIKPYSVEVRFTPWPTTRLNLLYPRLRQTAAWKAFLKAGELPPGWRAAFSWAELRLIPAPDERVSFLCSCPDWSFPCKHAMAVCCLLSEQIDTEPLLLLELQGLNRAALLQTGAPTPESGQLLDTSDFWQGQPPPLLSLPPTGDPQLPLSLLGALPGGCTKQRLLQALGPVYRQAAETLPALLPENRAGLSDV